MADKSGIEWCDATWNPVTGCTKVSPGCAHCYAETWAHRGMGSFADRHPFEEVRCHPERLDLPLRWRKPRRVFVNSLSDLFHEDVPDTFIADVFATMARAPRHTFQVLTKRADRMRRWMEQGDGWMTAAVNFSNSPIPGMAMPWPLPNVWLGVSTENQRMLDERVPLLLQTPAAVRFLSCEPLLEKVLLDNGMHSYLTCRSKREDVVRSDEPDDSEYCCDSFAVHGDHFHGIDWVIVGGESGPSARPCDLAWMRSIRDQCRSAGVPCFVKQVGSNSSHICRDRKGGDPAEWPEDLRVQEYPTPMSSPLL